MKAGTLMMNIRLAESFVRKQKKLEILRDFFKYYLLHHGLTDC
jgi:hypothetical protein